MMHPKPGRPPKRDRPNLHHHPYVEWIKRQPCDTCGRGGPSDFAHVQGPISLRTNTPLPRRKGPNIIVGLPLCKHDHTDGRESIHALGERGYGETHYGHPDAVALRAFAYMATFVRHLNYDLTLEDPCDAS